jgi:hypothetical protein
MENVLEATKVYGNKNAMPFDGMLNGGLGLQKSNSGLAGNPMPQFTGPNKSQKQALSKAKIKSNFGKVNNALGSKAGNIAMGAVGSALDIAKGFVPTQESKGKNPTGYETQQAIGDALTKVPIPIVQAAGLAYKGISMLAEATGGNTNTITKEQAEDLGISKGTRLANNIIGALHPGAG